jgi:phytoene dehydrogenase-like protein
VKKISYEYDALVVGSGPNGLAAAILLQQHGKSVLLLEGAYRIGGGLRTAELTLPGYKHDVCSAIHPLAVASPFFRTLPLQDFNLKYIYPDIAAAHPFDSGNAAVLLNSIAGTARLLNEDEQVYRNLLNPIVQNWPYIAADVLSSLHIPAYPLKMAEFGLKAMMSASSLALRFKTKEAKGLIAGMAAHATQPLTNKTTAAIALVLLANGHLKGWPLPQGGSQHIADALASYFLSIGGKIETNMYVTSFKQLPSAKATIFDVTPKQLLQIAGHKLSSIYKWQLNRYRYGMGVFKIDWALDAPIPFTAEACRSAGTIHLGNTFEEIVFSEQQTAKGKIVNSPFTLLAQPSIFDAARAPSGKHTAWAYCHVPHGSTADMTTAIEKQVERFAPGFRDSVLARNTMNTSQLEHYNANYIGGDINGGKLNLSQLFTRPALRWSPYKTSADGIYLCSSSTPPGSGVHGMCGYNAAKLVLNKEFNIKVKPLA